VLVPFNTNGSNSWLELSIDGTTALGDIVPVVIFIRQSNGRTPLKDDWSVVVRLKNDWSTVVRLKGDWSTAVRLKGDWSTVLRLNGDWSTAVRLKDDWVTAAVRPKGAGMFRSAKAHSRSARAPLRPPTAPLYVSDRLVDIKTDGSD